MTVPSEHDISKLIYSLNAGEDVNKIYEEKTPLSYAASSCGIHAVRAVIDAGADVNKKDNKGNTSLFYAVRRERNESVVRLLIDAGADVNKTNDKWKTPLFYAVKVSFNGDDVVRVLIDAGANANKTENKGKTALFYAVLRSNNRGVVHALIDAGADVNKTDNEGNTALFYAVQQWNNESVVRQLIDAGADVKKTNNEEKTALFYAVKLIDNEVVVRALIGAGADVNKMDNKGKTALFCAVQQSDNKGVVQALIDANVDVNRTDNEGKTACFYAVQRSKNEDVVRRFIDAGANVNALDNDGKTALFYAVQKVFNRHMVRLLIDAETDLNIPNNEGKTALFFAVKKVYNKSIVRAMIDAGAGVNRTDNEGKTALFYAVQQRDNEGVVRALLDAGADVNITDNEGKTALFYAVRFFSYGSVVRVLIEGGANVNRTDNEGKTALFYAVKCKYNKNVLPALIDAGADDQGKPAMVYAIQQIDNESVVQALINAGADVNITDNERKTALFYAVQEDDNKSVARALIGAGADVNKTDDEGKTALFYAVRCFSSKTIVHALIDAGADVNIYDNEGKTALFYAVLGNNNLICILIDAGALLNARDNYCKTPLSYALTESGFLADYLLEREASLCLEDNYSVLTSLIEEYYNLPCDLQDRLEILVKRKLVDNKQIFEAIINVAFCNIFFFKETSSGVNVDFLSALLRRATDCTSPVFDIGKRTTIKTILKTINGQPNQLLTKSNIMSKILSLFMKLGANPNSVDSDGNTALHHAIQLSSYGIPEETVINICNQLKEMGASFHVKNRKNETPLLRCLVSTVKNISSHGCQHWFEVQTQLAVCQCLILHGSNIEEKTESGQSALHLILELLRQVLLNEKLRIGYLDDLIRFLQKMFIAHKEKEIIKDDSGNTPLQVWASFELPRDQDYSSTIARGYTFRQLLKMFLDHFIDENKSHLHVKNENGETPLHLCRTWTAVELLLEAGANPNDVDSSGRSPLLVAAKNSKLVKNRGLLYSDILFAEDKFWRMVLNKGLDPWTVDIDDDSVLSVIMESESHDAARALVRVACDDRTIRSRPLVLFSLLTAICKDKSLDAQWKKDAAERILRSTKCPVNGNDREDSPLHYCCKNIVEVAKGSSIDEIKGTVHWRMVELLRSFGADYRIPDATDKSCLDIAEECRALKDLLMEPIDLDPVLIKPWKSVSKTNERCLSKVARHLESNHVKDYWYHEDPLARGSFGAVYAGINDKDGREVAIKRIQKISMPLPQDQREIASLTALADCEQVVRYLAFFEDSDFSYIVLELMEGNLEDLLNKSIAMKEREELCVDVVNGLSFMHRQGYLHRDLKPSNVLFKSSPKLCLKIADFGLCRRDDNTQLSTVYGSTAGTRSWIAPEVLKATKDQHSARSDMFSCALVLHYILSVKKHPFTPEDCAKGELQICNETERNIILDNKEGWDDSLSPEASHLLERLLESDARKRPTAAESLAHPLFWSKAKKMDVLIAVGSQTEFECPRARRTLPLTAVETDLEASFGTIVKYVDWNNRGNVHMPAIYTEIRRTGRRRYDTRSVVELVRFIRNAHAHVSESTRPIPIRKQLLEDFVFLEYFPNLVMEVYKAVTTHGWDQTREEIKYAMTK